MEDVDWPGKLVCVISKGTRVRQPVPASPNASRYLGSYPAADGLPDPGQPVWRTRRGDPRPLTYWAMRRILQRANDRLGTNWTLDDARHTAARMASRMARDPAMPLTDVQVLPHSGIRIEEANRAVASQPGAVTAAATGELIPLLQIAPSNTDTERLLVVSPELADVLSAIISRIRGFEPLSRGHAA